MSCQNSTETAAGCCNAKVAPTVFGSSLVKRDLDELCVGHTLLDGFELTHGFMFEKLKLKRDDFSAATKEELVAKIKTSADNA